MTENIEKWLTPQDYIRISHTRKMQELAIKHNRCKEQFQGHCMYPHCQCLYGENGHIDPVTGEEQTREAVDNG